MDARKRAKLEKRAVGRLLTERCQRAVRTIGTYEEDR